MRLGLFTLFLVLCVGCGDPKNTALPQDLSKMESIKPAVEKLKPEDRDLLAGYIVRHGVGAAIGNAFGVKQEAIPAGMTIGKAINDQREFAAKQAAEAEAKKAAEQKAEADRKALADQMAQVLGSSLKSISLHKATFENFDVENYVKLGIEFQNKGTKTIIGIKGTATFRDQFGDAISSAHLKLDINLKPGQIVTQMLQKNFNQFMEQDKKLASASAATTKLELVPEVILFSDGSKFEAPSSAE
jgi:hypothetical protein